jgi:hypothetical protein
MFEEVTTEAAEDVCCQLHDVRRSGGRAEHLRLALFSRGIIHNLPIFASDRALTTPAESIGKSKAIADGDFLFVVVVVVVS